MFIVCEDLNENRPAGTSKRLSRAIFMDLVVRLFVCIVFFSRKTKGNPRKKLQHRSFDPEVFSSIAIYDIKVKGNIR